MVTFIQVTRQKHIWGTQDMVPRFLSKSGHEQREWQCQCCPLVKVTVMPQGLPARREYRVGPDGAQFAGAEPECVPVAKESSKESAA